MNAIKQPNAASASKLKVGILFGGRSPEHNISLLSAYNVVANMDKDLFEPVLLAIGRDGTWYHLSEMNISDPTDAQKVKLPASDRVVYLSQNTGDGAVIDKQTGEIITSIDVLYPVLHGANGEDGSIQGLAKVAGLPCVGCSILGSSAGMDKDVTKRLLRDAGIGVADFVTLRRGYNDKITYAEMSQRLGTALFIKPANLGSSVGVSFVDNEADYLRAVEEGFRYDPKVIVEEKISGREIECAVLGNQHPEASTIGEILPKTEWYTFENKYVDDDGAGLAIPADIGQDKIEEARQIAIKSYVNLECCGLTRVDMFLKADGQIIVNEVNTLPGFTKISMYPKLWGYSGLEYKDLISRLISLAVERYEAERALIY